MDTHAKNLNKEEKENVLTVLNEFSEEYKGNSKSVAVLVSSVKELSEKITLLLEREETPISKNENYSKLEELISSGIENINSIVRSNALPDDNLRELSQQLEKNILLLKNPLAQKTVHHHHIPKIGSIAIALIVALAVVAAGWYTTADKLDGYIANDTKYRYLKLDTANFYLQRLLYRVDSMSHKNGFMRDAVLAMEEKNRNNFELLQKAQRMNAEAENLKAGAKKLKEKAVKK